LKRRSRRRGSVAFLAVSLALAVLPGCVHPRSPRAAAARAEAACPAPKDHVWLGASGVAYSTRDLARRAAALTDRIASIQETLEACLLLPGPLWPTFEAGPSGIALAAEPAGSTAGESGACLQQALAAAHVEAATKSSVLVTFEAPGASALPGPEVGRVAREHGDEVRECFESAMVARAPFEGQVAIRFLVGRGGRVVRSEVLRNTTTVLPLGCCIAARAARWQFPEPLGGETAVVDYPWDFRVAR
jgi:hypothetical protein